MATPPPMDLRATTGQVFAANVHADDAAMLARRRRAAAALSAPLTPMSDLLRDDSGRPQRSATINGARLRECASEAIRVACEGRRSLVLTDDALQAAKALQRAAARLAEAEEKGEDAQRAWLALVQLRQCRDIFELLRVVAAVDARASKLALVVVGPLARLFSPFATAAGLTAGGEGLLRVLQLAVKRLRATSGAAILALDPSAVDTNPDANPKHGDTLRASIQKHC